MSERPRLTETNLTTRRTRRSILRLTGGMGLPGKALDNTVRANVNLIAEHFRTQGPLLSALVEAGKIEIVGARYDLDTGKVEILA